MDGRLIDPRAVRANIERMHSDNPTATVVIQANKSSANKTLVQVMDASRQAGIYSIALAAEEG
jgi:biopolymer transport protein ExbD